MTSSDVDIKRFDWLFTPINKVNYISLYSFGKRLDFGSYQEEVELLGESDFSLTIVGDELPVRLPPAAPLAR